MTNNKKSQPVSDSLREFAHIPDGWLVVKDYAIRACISQPGLNERIRKGRIAFENMARVRRPKGPPATILDWNSTAYNFISARAEHLWPPDFELNDAGTYKPIPVATAAAPGQAPVTPPAPPGQIIYKPVIDIHSAKYRAEQLKIQKLENEMQLADNATILIKEVVSANVSCALSVRGALQKSIRKMTPLLCATGDPRKVEIILANGISEALANLADLEGVDNGAA